MMDGTPQAAAAATDTAPAVALSTEAERFAALIERSLTQVTSGIIALGHVLIEAKEALAHGEFEAMIEARTRFSVRTAERFMAIARDRRIATHVSVMPAAWGTLYELTRLPDERFAECVETGAITPEMERSEVQAILRAERRGGRILDIKAQAETPALAGALERSYPVIVADPPWRFEDPPMGASGRSAENHYPTMPLAAICALPVGEIATPAAVCFLWNRHIPASLAALEAWGFKFRTEAVWDKVTAGTGFWFRDRHELVMVGTRGGFPPPAMGESVASVFRWKKGAHSEKPASVYAYLDAIYPDLPKLEMFPGNADRPGWDRWGHDRPDRKEGEG